MSHWEQAGKSDDWYTPAYIFDALGCLFDCDVAGPFRPTRVPCRHVICANSLDLQWRGFVWMNPPFGGRNSIEPWLNKFFEHGNGIALTPDRTSCPWWQSAARKADAILFINGKVKFERPDGSIGASPSNGTTLFAAGDFAQRALFDASAAGLGFLASDLLFTSPETSTPGTIMNSIAVKP